MGFQLVDDGTLDTVIRNNETGQEHRFNYQCSGFEGTYEEWLEVLDDVIDSLELE